MSKSYLTFHDPAKKWEEALPIGNGSLGGMIYGHVNKEIIQINEDTLWSGKPLDDSSFDITDYLPRARKLIDEEKYVEAHEYINTHMLGHWSQNYLPMGNVLIDFKHKGRIDDYKRELDMVEGISYVSYIYGDVTYSREYFCTKVDDLLAVHIEVSRIGALNCVVTVESFLKHTVSAPWDYLICQGEAPIHVDPVYDSKEEPIIYKDDEKGIAFATLVKVDTDGVVFTNNNNLDIQHGSYMTLYFACKTNFIDPFTPPNSQVKNPLGLCEGILEKAMAKGYSKIKADHITDFRGFMDRVHLQLDDSDSSLPMDQHILGMKDKEKLDGRLIEQLFQLGRYLTVSASREGSQATNLQGIWNCMIQAPWSSNYTININTQMNYWPVDVANLSECYEPLLRLVSDLSISGINGAKALGCSGWTANHNTDLWRLSIPVSGNAQFAFWPLGGPWLATHLYEHFLFTEDMDYLREIFPIIQESAKFCLDWAYIDVKTGYRVTSPSTSPENAYKMKDGSVSSITKASTMDMNIMWQVLSDCIHAMAILDIKDEQFLTILNETREKLYPLKINAKGQLGEWWDDQTYCDDGHRHVSHLCGLYPGHRVDCDQDTELTKAHHQSLEDRIANGGGHTSWSCAWVMLLYARLRDRNRTKDMMMKFFKHSLIRNGLSSHPPFQIDGNYGFTAAVCEMLIQSHNDYIEILPALPEELSKGSFEGLRARGGFEISAKWYNNQVEEVCIRSNKDGICRLKVNDQLMDIRCEKANHTIIFL